MTLENEGFVVEDLRIDKDAQIKKLSAGLEASHDKIRKLRSDLGDLALETGQLRERLGRTQYDLSESEERNSVLKEENRALFDDLGKYDRDGNGLSYTLVLLVFGCLVGGLWTVVFGVLLGYWVW